MRYDGYGQVRVNTRELCDLIYQTPDLDVTKFLVDDPDEYNRSIRLLYSDLDSLKPYLACDWGDIADFDALQQSRWRMPERYKHLDIAKWIIEQCQTDEELQRVGQELLLYQERNLFNLLKYLKYLVDTLREHKIVWGVGRGSSVSSYVLYLIGVHKINSLYYDLDIEEFLK